MSNTTNRSPAKPLSLSDDEIAIVEMYRALCLDRHEGLRRLSTPSTSPILPQEQELHSNLAAVAEDLLSPDPTAECSTRK